MLPPSGESRKQEAGATCSARERVTTPNHRSHTVSLTLLKYKRSGDGNDELDCRGTSDSSLQPRLHQLYMPFIPIPTLVRSTYHIPQPDTICPFL